MIDEIQQYVQIGEVALDEIEKSNLIPKLSKLYHKMFLQLMADGFKREEALEIIINLKIGSK